MPRRVTESARKPRSESRTPRSSSRRAVTSPEEQEGSTPLRGLMKSSSPSPSGSRSRSISRLRSPRTPTQRATPKKATPQRSVSTPVSRRGGTRKQKDKPDLHIPQWLPTMDGMRTALATADWGHAASLGLICVIALFSAIKKCGLRYVTTALFIDMIIASVGVLGYTILPEARRVFAFLAPMIPSVVFPVMTLGLYGAYFRPSTPLLDLFSEPFVSATASVVVFVLSVILEFPVAHVISTACIASLSYLAYLTNLPTLYMLVGVLAAAHAVTHMEFTAFGKFDHWDLLHLFHAMSIFLFAKIAI